MKKSWQLAVVRLQMKVGWMVLIISSNESINKE